MPFKLTKDGWVSDPKGKHKIPTRKGLFDGPLPGPQVLDEFGHPVDADDEYWKGIVDEANKKENRS